jgi:hypothetical protein
MRCSAWSSLACSVCSALVLSVPAGAHIDATPAFLPTGGVEIVSLTAHNDRAIAMTGFAASVPAGLRIHGVDELDGWEGSAEETTATWAGGSVAPGAAATFGLHLEASAEPGPISLQVEQRYRDGAVVRWPVALTVVPAEESSSPGYVWVVGISACLLALAGVGLAVKRWRTDSLQEK